MKGFQKNRQGLPNINKKNGVVVEGKPLELQSPPTLAPSVTLFAAPVVVAGARGRRVYLPDLLSSPKKANGPAEGGESVARHSKPVSRVQVFG